MATLTQLDNDIQAARDQLARLEVERNNLEAAILAANAARPAGIPNTWKPVFEGIPPNVRIYAWFDPNKFGERFR